jgi:cytosine/adenosine deaminase-related metal-dependent hydrolase
MRIVRGSVVLTAEAELPIIRDGAVAVEGSAIIVVGSFADLVQRYPRAQVMGSEHHWVLPGLVNAHSHGAMVTGSFRQGIMDLPLERWLLRLYNSGLLDGQMPISYWNTLHQNAELIRSGVTCTSDFYYGDGSEPYMGAEHGLRAYQSTGLRVVLFLSALDKPAVDNGNLEPFLHLMPAELAERARALGPLLYSTSREQYLARWKRAYDEFNTPAGAVHIGLGPDGPARCTPGFLSEIKALAHERGAPIQMHLLETKYQRLWGQCTYGMSLVQYLHQVGFLGPELSLAHCVWLSTEDMGILAASGASAVHCASSNLRLYDGIAPVHEMLGRGINVGLGTDNFGFADNNDLLDEMRLAALLQRVPGIHGETLSGQEAFAMATINGARALGLANTTGSLAPGKRADLITLSTEHMLSPFMNPLQDPHEILWRRARQGDVRDVLVNGRLVMEDGRLTTIDLPAVEETLRAWYADLWAARGPREKEILGLLHEIDPFVIRFFQQYAEEDLRAHYLYNAR